MTSDLFIDNLAAWSLQAAVLIALGAVLPLALGLRNPRTQLAYYQALLLAAVLLPLLQRWHRATVFLQPLSAVPAKLPSAQPLAEEAIRTWQDYALAILLAGIALRLLYLAAGLFRLRRFRANARPIHPLTDPLQRALDGTAASAAICVSPDVDSPVTFGFSNPVVLLPANTLELPPDAQQAIATHELLHVRRADWLWALAEEIVAIALWFHPAVWWLIAQIRLTREQAVDRQVLALTNQPDPYVAALLSISAPRLQPDFSPAPPFLRRHHLTTRIRTLFTEVTMTKPRLITSYASIALALALASWLAINQFPLNAAPQFEQPGIVKSDRVPVIYPPEAKARRIEGTVTIEVKIGGDGEVLDARVLNGPDELRKAALASVLQWHFKNDEKAVRFTQVSVDFRLSDSNTPRTASGIVAEAVDPAPSPNFPATGGVRRIRVGGNVQSTKLVDQPRPSYPPLAKQARIQGTVRFWALIDKTGHVANLQLVSGHPLLVPASQDSVKQWTYQSTLLNGEPVEVITMIDVNFTLMP